MLPIRIQYIIFELLLVVIYSITYGFLESIDSSTLVRVLGYLALFQFMFVLYSWWRIQNNVINAYIVFSFALYAFTLSQPILEALGIAVEHRRLWDDFGITRNIYCYTAYYTLIAISCFHLGALCVKDKEVTTNYIFNYDIQSIKKLKVFSISLAIISAPFYLAIIITQYFIVKTFGYTGLYTIESSIPRAFQIISDGFIPAMLTIFCISVLQKNNIKTISILVAIFVFLPPLVLGGRSNAMIIAAIFIIIYATVKTVRLKQILSIGLLAIGLIVTLNIVGKIRVGNDRSIDAYQNAMDENKDNPILETISEMGWSMYPTALTISVMPDKIDYSYGASYFWALVSVIPNLGFWDGIHPGKANDPGYKLDQYADQGYGIGYSIVAGTYNEFGAGGIIIMFLYGLGFVKIFSCISTKTLYSKPVKYILAIIFLWFSIKFIRNSFDSFVRNIVFYILPFYFISIIKIENCKNDKKQKRTERIPKL